MPDALAQVAAWLGLVPRHDGTGGRVRMLGSLQGDIEFSGRASIRERNYGIRHTNRGNRMA